MLKAFSWWVLILSSCSGAYQPNHANYKALYEHLSNIPTCPKANWDSDCYLVIFVNARHLDYTDNYSFLNTILIHPSDGSRNRDIGHAWLYVKGVLDDKPVVFYGGHSGERGLSQAKYFDGIMNYIDFGYANPTLEQCRHTRYEPNPAKYLWETQKDGYLEYGSGNHTPTYAAKINLTQKQFEKIWNFVHSYDYSNYALTGNQCSTFVVQAASLAGIDLDCKISITLQPNLYLKGECVRLWEDPKFSLLTISTPDIIERSLMQIVAEGKAEYVR